MYLFTDKLPMPGDLCGATQTPRVQEREDIERKTARQATSEVLPLARHIVVKPIVNEKELVPFAVTKQ